jgi:hypothetical protein
VPGLTDDCFATIIAEFLATGGEQGPVGDAAGILVPAVGITTFAVDWLERRFG